jgi:hypothetical protein
MNTLDPFGIVKGVGDKLDPTKVGRADTSGVSEASQEMRTRGNEFLDTRRESFTPSQVQADKVKSERVAANDVSGERIGPVQGMGDLRSAMNVAAGNVQQAGQMDPRMQQFLMAAQQSGQYSPEAIQMMQAAAAGQGPSAAQAQMQAGTDQAIRAQMAMAGARGFNPAAMRGAQMQGAEMLQTSANQAAQLRAQEQQAAQQQFLQASLQQELNGLPFSVEKACQKITQEL